MNFKFFFSSIFIFYSFFSCAEIKTKDFIPSFDPKAKTVFTFSSPINSHRNLKKSFLEKLKTTFLIKMFVESGPYLGGTTLIASELFNEVHSIELSDVLYKDIKARFKNNKKVFIYPGNSDAVFLEILPKINARILFYLNGHYSSNKLKLNTSILKELQSIKAARKKDSLILINNIRCFQKSLYGESKEYPEIDVVIEALLEINPSYQICFLGDCLFAFPKSTLITVSEVVSACTLHRVSPKMKFSEEELEQADVVIGRAALEEKSELINYYQTYGPCELEKGLRSYSTFWNGLIFLDNGHISPAYDLFKLAAKHSIPDWRVTYYVGQ